MDLSLTPKTNTSSKDIEKPNTISNAPPLTPKHHFLYHAPPLYKECLRNHAASIGRHSLDGCGEFTPLPASPLTCAACGCHRNFHRREDPPPQPFPPPTPLNCAGKPGEDCYGAPPPPHLNFSVTTPTTPPRERKRFRTRFSKEQKDEMSAFSERLGWKIRRTDDVAIEEFCNKVGVSRGVLKVWMHNNKSTFGTKKDASNNFAKNGSNLSISSTDGVSANGVSTNGDGSLSSA